VLALCLTSGSLQIGHFFGSPLYHASDKLFSEGSAFHFSFERPDDYTFAWLLSPLEGECCKSFYHLAERFDAPYHFDRWQSMHTLIMPRTYYDAAAFVPVQGIWRSGRPGFAELMRFKFHWYPRYAVTERREQTDGLLARRVLPLPDDRDVRARDLRTGPGAPPEAPADTPYEPAPPTVIRKTANTLLLSATVERPMFLLYTDLFHPGFRALVDGEERPVLKGMNLFKALELETGRHTVEFRFEPRCGAAPVLYLLVSVPALLVAAGWSLSSVLRA
jgi:hypothetical protein